MKPKQPESQEKKIARPRSDCCNAEVSNYRGEYSAFATCQKCEQDTTVHEFESPPAKEQSWETKLRMYCGEYAWSAEMEDGRGMDDIILFIRSLLQQERQKVLEESQKEKIELAINVVQQWGHDNGTYYYHGGLSTLESAFYILKDAWIIKNVDKVRKAEIEKYYKLLSTLERNT